MTKLWARTGCNFLRTRTCEILTFRENVLIMLSSFNSVSPFQSCRVKTSVLNCIACVKTMRNQITTWDQIVFLAIQQRRVKGSLYFLVRVDVHTEGRGFAESWRGVKLYPKLVDFCGQPPCWRWAEWIELHNQQLLPRCDQSARRECLCWWACRSIAFHGPGNKIWLD